ncbi:VOC family protein [Fimbriimonas ginsengisoli]|uniref:PhnB protein n=1 Tax=Fimbriimonas ginsengisoli Gsoil 348 TaxID=661478 RepID=A0A068NMW9_FIMGI|nr:VOC family protein [Fimbriimonas ginsengisoli]AIE84747.1 PhnB protein [Fimbriimonas ginsengisoli Gsoil 348]
MNVQTYIFFDGACEEAIGLYREALGAELMFLMKYKDGPPDLIPSGGEEKVFHATIRIGETAINLCDDLKNERGRLGGFALLAHMDSDEEAERVFAALKVGGAVFLPLEKTFWAARYGIVTDRFGVTWKVQS